MVNNGTSPTIEESLKMIEEKLKIQKKGISEKTNVCLLYTSDAADE